MGKAHSTSISIEKSSISNDYDLGYTIANFLNRDFALGFNFFNLQSEYNESLAEVHTQGFSSNIFYDITEY